jgi:hypothetical protein
MKCCSALVAGQVPQFRKPVYGAKDDFRSFAELLASEQHRWNLDSVEEQVMTVIDAAIL